MLALIAMSMFSLTAFAAGEDSGEYYLSYKKYVAAENPDGSKTITYNMVTDQISNLLDEGIRRYESGADYNGNDGYYKPFTNSYGSWYERSWAIFPVPVSMRWSSSFPI